MIPGTVWWKVHCWLEHKPLEGEWEHQWFHKDLMLVVNAGPTTRYNVGVLPYGLTRQNFAMN